MTVFSKTIQQHEELKQNSFIIHALSSVTQRQCVCTRGTCPECYQIMTHVCKNVLQQLLVPSCLLATGCSTDGIRAGVRVPPAAHSLPESRRACQLGLLCVSAAQPCEDATAAAKLQASACCLVCVYVRAGLKLAQSCC